MLKLIYSGEFEIGDCVLRVPMQTRFPQICQRLVESSGRLRMRTNCFVQKTLCLPKPLRILYLCAHICGYDFSCPVLPNGVQTPTSPARPDYAAHDQVAVYF